MERSAGAVAFAFLSGIPLGICFFSCRCFFAVILRRSRRTSHWLLPLPTPVLALAYPRSRRFQPPENPEPPKRALALAPRPSDSGETTPESPHTQPQKQSTKAATNDQSTNPSSSSSNTNLSSRNSNRNPCSFFRAATQSPLPSVHNPSHHWPLGSGPTSSLKPKPQAPCDKHPTDKTPPCCRRP